MTDGAKPALVYYVKMMWLIKAILIIIFCVFS
jgi:hypothetical protein